MPEGLHVPGGKRLLRKRLHPHQRPAGVIGAVGAAGKLAPVPDGVHVHHAVFVKKVVPGLSAVLGQGVVVLEPPHQLAVKLELVFFGVVAQAEGGVG